MDQFYQNRRGKSGQQWFIKSIRLSPIFSWYIPYFQGLFLWFTRKRTGFDDSTLQASPYWSTLCTGAFDRRSRLHSYECPMLWTVPNRDAFCRDSAERLVSCRNAIAHIPRKSPEPSENADWALDWIRVDL